MSDRKCNFSVDAICGYGAGYYGSAVRCSGDDNAKHNCPIWEISSAVEAFRKTIEEVEA